MASMYRNCTTISRKMQAIYDRENRKIRVISKAWGVPVEVYNNDGGWGNHGKAYVNFLTALDKKISNARNSLSANKTTQNKQRKTLYVAISSTLSVAVSETVSVDTIEDDDGGGDSDPDQPEPPSTPWLAHLFTSPRLISSPQRNRFLYSWQSAPNYCSMVGGGKI